MPKSYRYPGVRPFSRTQANVFFGRDLDRKELVKMIDQDKITVLYSKSGLGKSSLLNAALVPDVEAAGKFMAFPFRFGAWYKGKEEIPLDIVVSTLAQKAGDQPCFLDKFATPSLNPIWFYLKKIQLQNPDKVGFLLIFDQFEELFTHPIELVRNFGRRLASALYQEIPQGILNSFEKKYEENPKFLSDAEMDLLHKPFDLKILPAIRSDRLSLLDELTPYLPKILARLYRLDALSADAAEEAILNPAYQNTGEFTSPRFDYSDQALDYMLDYLTKGRTEAIESFQLQILCQYIESELVIDKGLTEIKKEDIGDLDAIYRSYYERQIQRLPNPADIASARKLIEEGLIEEKDMRRLSLHESQIGQFYGIGRGLLDQLVETRLLRPEPHYKGGYLYELSHDSIVAPILKAKKDRVEVELRLQEEEERKQAEIKLREKEKQAEKERRRLRTARRANFFSILTVILAATTFFYFLKVQYGIRDEKLKEQEANYQERINQANARSSELTSMALVEMEMDRTVAFHLAQSAVESNPTNQLAVKVRNDLLLKSNLYPFYQNTLAAHSGYIIDFAISPDQKWLVSSSMDSTLIVWDLGKFLPVDTLTGHRGGIVDVDFSPDGRSILSGDAAGLARVWPFSAGKVNRGGVIDIDYEARIFDVAFANNGQHVLVGGEYRPDPGPQRHLSVFSLFEKRWIIRNIALHEGAITNIQTTERQDLALSSGNDRSIKLFNYRDKNEIFTIAGLPANVGNMDYSGKSGILVAGLEDGTVHIWTRIKQNNPDRILSFKAHENKISDILILDDEKRILTCGYDRTAKLWDLNGNLLKVFLGHKDGLHAVAMAKNSQVVITGGEDKIMNIWSMAPYEERSFDLLKAGADTIASAVACLGDKVLIGKHDGRALLFSLDGKLMRSFDHRAMILDVAISPDKKYVVTGGIGSQPIKIWDIRNASTPPVIPEGRLSTVEAVAFSNDGKWLLAGLRDNRAVLWDFAQNKLIRSFEGHKGAVRDVAISPKGDRVLTASADGTAKLWTIDGDLITEIARHTDQVTSVAFHPSLDGVFLTGGWDNRVALWKLDSLQREFFGHTSDINQVAFSPDGKTILSASSDRSLRRWDMNGSELESFIWHEDSILDAAFSPADAAAPFIVTVSKDRTARLWRPGDVEKITKNIAPLSEEQRKKYGF
jgi:WD40 repeat protein